MKNMSFILWKKLNRLFGQPNVYWTLLCVKHCPRYWNWNCKDEQNIPLFEGIHTRETNVNEVQQFISTIIINTSCCWNTRDGNSHCLRFSGKAFQTRQRFVWLLADGSISLEGVFQEELGKVGWFLLHPYRNGTKRGAFDCSPANFLRLNFFVLMPFFRTPFSSPACLSSCCMCGTFTTNVPLCPLDMRRPLLFNKVGKFISMHWTPLILVWQFSITRILESQNTSSFWNPTIWLKVLMCKTAIAELQLVSAPDSRWFFFGLTYMRHGEPVSSVLLAVDGRSNVSWWNSDVTRWEVGKWLLAYWISARKIEITTNYYKLFEALCKLNYFFKNSLGKCVQNYDLQAFEMLSRCKLGTVYVSQCW